MAKRMKRSESLRNLLGFETSSKGRAAGRNTIGRPAQGESYKTATAPSSTEHSEEGAFKDPEANPSSQANLSNQHEGSAAETRPQPKKRKDNTRQMSLYLEPSLYDRLRECAHVQRTKMHPIIVEGILLALAKRESEK